MPSIRPEELAQWHMANYKRRNVRKPPFGVKGARPWWLRVEVWIPILALLLTVLQWWSHR